MHTDAPKPHNLTIDLWTYSMWQSGRVHHFVRRQGKRLMARGERVLVYQSSPRRYLFPGTIAQIDRAFFREDVVIVNGLRLGDHQSDLLAYQAGYTDYPSLVADLRRLPYDGLLIQITSLR